MAITAAMAQDLGNLIANLNPYTNYTNLATTNKTGDMDIYTGNSTPATPPNPPNPRNGTASQIEIEVDNRYPGEWCFKGIPHRLGKAVRIRYRFPVLDAQGNLLYYVDDHLLIGFEGSNGG